MRLISLNGAGDATLANQTIMKASDVVTQANQATNLTAIGGSAHSFEFSELNILGRLDGFHATVHILFIIPEAIAAINTHNTAILTILETLGRVDTILQDNAINGSVHLREYNLIVLGTNNGTAWDTANLADIKAVNVPVLCVDKVAAVYLKIGNALNKTVINGEAKVEGSVIGIGRHGYTGIDVGANTIAVAGTEFCTLDISNANITGEVYLAYEAVDANTDTIICFTHHFTSDGTPSTDLDGVDFPHERIFYGAAYSMADLNSLGQGLLGLCADTLYHHELTGSGFVGDIGALNKRLFGNMGGSFSNTKPLVEWIAGKDSVGSPLPVGKSLADIIGTQYVDAAGNPDVDTIREHLRAGLLNGTGTVLPANKSLYDEICLDRLDDATFGLSALETLVDDLETSNRCNLD